MTIEGNMIPSELDKSYIAGFFDGEGNVTLGHRDHHAGGRDQWELNIQVSNSKRSVLEWVQGFYGGCISINRSHNPKRVDTFTLRLHARRSVRFLSDIYPYLHLKKRQVEIAVEFRGLLKPRNECWVGVPEENRTRRLELIAELRVLNHKGPVKKEGV